MISPHHKDSWCRVWLPGWLHGWCLTNIIRWIFAWVFMNFQLKVLRQTIEKEPFPFLLIYYPLCHQEEKFLKLGAQHNLWRLICVSLKQLACVLGQPWYLGAWWTGTSWAQHSNLYPTWACLQKLQSYHWQYGYYLKCTFPALFHLFVNVTHLFLKLKILQRTMKQQKVGKISAFPCKITYWKRMWVCQKNLHKHFYYINIFISL